MLRENLNFQQRLTCCTGQRRWFWTKVAEVAVSTKEEMHLLHCFQSLCSFSLCFWVALGFRSDSQLHRQAPHQKSLWATCAKRPQTQRIEGQLKKICKGYFKLTIFFSPALNDTAVLSPKWLLSGNWEGKIHLAGSSKDVAWAWKVGTMTEDHASSQTGTV